VNSISLISSRAIGPILALSTSFSIALSARAAAPEASPPPPVAAEPAAAEEPAPAPEPEPAPATSPEQIAPAAPQTVGDIYGKGMTVALNEDGSRFFRLLTWHQVWGRYQQLNPGSAVNGRARDGVMDVGLRRSRLLLFGQISPRFKVVTHFGINNQTFNGQRKPQVYIHDAWGEFEVLPKNMLFFGAGLHYINGISRMTGASTISFMGLDSPIMPWPTIEASDQFARQMGFYVRGLLGRLDYRLALNRPFTSEVGLLGKTAAKDVDGADIDGVVNESVGAYKYNPYNNTFAVSGYFAWNFFDKEFGALPFYAGTYMGSKKVLNIGAGFYVHPGSMAKYAEAYEPDDDEPELAEGQKGALASSLEQTAFRALSADIFADLPIGEGGKKGALSAYAAYYNYDFGDKYVRNVGIMSVAAADPNAETTSLNGPGNAYPMIGTGSHIYAQGGYVLPFSIGVQKFMPYFDLQISKMGGLDAASNIFGAGINWFILSHWAKVTLHYRNRPIFMLNDDNKKVVDSRASEVILQTQIAF
jgi:hypothetical protein